MKNSSYYLVILKELKKDISEDIQMALQDYDCDGVEDFSLEEATVDQILGDRAYSGGDIPQEVLFEVERFCQESPGRGAKLFFYQGEAQKNAQTFCDKLEEKGSCEVKLLEFKWEDWNQEWRKYYSPIEVGEQLRVVPEWMKNDGDEENEIYIYPGMGFGTGEHETTYLCLKAFENLRAYRGVIKRVLDFGCGSGILGIAALRKIPHIYCEFCDVDRNALDNCRQNLLLNFTEDVLRDQRLVSRERYQLSPDAEKFDLIFANILAPVLKSEKNILQDDLKSGGKLIISGILSNQVDEVKDEYRDLIVHDHLSKGEWSCLVFEKL